MLNSASKISAFYLGRYIIHHLKTGAFSAMRKEVEVTHHDVDPRLNTSKFPQDITKHHPCYPDRTCEHRSKFKM
jgi:hypothetical protein